MRWELLLSEVLLIVGFGRGGKFDLTRILYCLNWNRSGWFVFVPCQCHNGTIPIIF